MANSAVSEDALVIELQVDAGQHPRVDTPIDAMLKPDDALYVRTAGELAATASLVALDGPRSNGAVPVQLDSSGRITWRLESPLAAGETRRYRCVVERARGGRAVEPTSGVAIRLAGDHVWFTRDGQLLTRYAYLGNWKPYFWPVFVKSGNIVRGSSSEHQHQTGLFFAYGGHGGDGTTNVWSDWDEPPYGPCGKIVHQGFEILEGGAVYGRLVQRLIYTRSDGPRLFGEVRDVRIVPLADGSLFFDVARRAERPDEAGPWPFIFSARVADTMRLADLRQRDDAGIPRPLDQPGHLTAPAPPQLEVPRTATYRTPSPWLDWSGPVGTGVAGLAFFAHPETPASERGITAAGYGCLTLSHQHPGARDTVFRYGALAHDGDAEAASVAHRYDDYANPPRVAVEILQRPPSTQQEH